MAVTSIWAVHHSVKEVLDYAANPDKTENPNADDLAETCEALLGTLRDGDVVLFKASRSIGAERIIDYLRDRL